MLDETDDDVEYNQAMIAEEEAYQALHPYLLEKFRDKWVAVFEGKLVDHDDDSVALYQRMRQKYPGKFVLMTPVRTEAVESYQVITGWLVDGPETPNPGV